MTTEQPHVAVVDYGLGNLHSVAQACRATGMQATTTADAAEIWAADAVILPGVGAFGDAMAALRRLDLVSPLRDVVAADRTVIGLCLGQQLLLDSSDEFGDHEGLGLLPGVVRRFPAGMHEPGRAHPLKVPQVGWNGVHNSADCQPGDTTPAAWAGTALEGLASGVHLYFVHSYHVVLDDPDAALAWTRYGDVAYCSAISAGNVIAFQFHPERSGPAGLRIYENIARGLRANAVTGVA